MAIKLADAVVFLATNDKDLKSGLDKAKRTVKDAAAGIGNTFVKGAQVATVAAAGAMVAAVAGVGAAAMNVSADTRTAAADIAASLGIPIEEAERLAEVAKEVWGDNFTESVTEAAEAVKLVNQQLGLTPESGLKQATEDAIALRDVFEVEVSESVDAAKVLMDELGLSAEEAFDLIAAGYQRGLNRSDDFIDTIGEYGSLFADAGFDAEEFFSILETGSQGGVLGTDKIADAIKEMLIKLNEGGTEIQGAFEQIGLDFDAIAAKVSAGDATWADYFNQIVEGINGLDDPIARSQAQVAIFGTMAEDLGVSFTEGLSSTQTTMDEMAGSAEALNAKYATMSDMATGLWRKVVLAVTPASDKFLELADELMPDIEAAVESLTPILLNLVETAIIPLIEQVVEWITKFSELDPKTQAMITKGIMLVAAITPLVALLGALAPLFGAVATAVGLLLSPVGLVVAGVAGLVAVLFDVGGAGTWAREKLEEMGLEGVAEALGRAQEKAKAFVDTVKGLVSGEISFGELIVSPGWVIDLLKWVWPPLMAVDWILDLLGWEWPELTVSEWVVTLTGWAWPTLDKPGWIDKLLGFEWPKMPSLPGWLGGGNDEVGQNAEGTSNWRGGLTWVGEKGPEIVNLPRGSQVFPADVSAAMAGAGREVHIHNTNIINNEIDEYRLARRMAEMLRRGGL